MQIVPVREHLVKVTLAGRLDTTGVGQVETRFIASLVPGANNAVVDFSGVDFVTSLGIRMIVSAARGLRMRQAKMAIYGLQEQVQQVFDIGNIGQMVPICATEADALSAVGAA